MKLEILNEILKEQKGEGAQVFILASNGQLFESGKQTGKFAVKFTTDGKLYTYSYKSVYALAERLNLIPDNNLDYWKESENAIIAMKSGIPYTSICGLSDTIRHILGKDLPKDKTVKLVYHESGLDKYDRQTWTFESFQIIDNPYL